ncbi:vWA domain-containing protein [Laceyella putida]|uniref:VWA domain-containing protein n=1 Tax=Laceyella putida TaxID=110101 RepID=A0ABW2RQT8_9BACL
MRITKSAFLSSSLLICSLLFLSGCATVIEKIQHTTGNQVEKVEQLAVQESEEQEAEETPRHEEKSDLPKSPAPYTELNDILTDDGKGEYAGEKYNRDKVFLALDQMPKGLTDDKAYAYLLGLVGENYRSDVDRFKSLGEVDYKKKVDVWVQARQKYPKPTPASAPKEQPIPTPKPEPPKKVNMSVLLDSSGSMESRLPEQSKSKMDSAKQGIEQLASALPQDRSMLQVKVYGHQGTSAQKDKELSCQSEAKIYAADKVDNGKLKEALSRVHPAGYNPLALVMHNSSRDLQKGAPATVENHMLIISDGFENCGGDPVQVAKRLHQDYLANIHVIGLDVEPDTERQLREVSTVTGGDYQTVTDEKELKEAVKERVQAVNRLNEPWQMRALHTVINAHHQDEKGLTKHHKQMMEKVQLEYQRLDEANLYIKKEGKIDKKTWTEIDSWISGRRQQLETYTESRYGEVDSKLDVAFQEETHRLLNEWEKDGGKKEEFQNKAVQLLKDDLLKKKAEEVEVQTDLANKQSE